MTSRLKGTEMEYVDIRLYEHTRSTQFKDTQDAVQAGLAVLWVLQKAGIDSAEYSVTLRPKKVEVDAE